MLGSAHEILSYRRGSEHRLREGRPARLDWQNKCADFSIPDDEQRVLRVGFHTEVIVRMLDEMPLSIESDASTSQGLVAHHFAYRVEGAPFANNQPDAWKQVFGSMKHFRFITGWGCLDVLALGDPKFAVIPKSH